MLEPFCLEYYGSRRRCRRRSSCRRGRASSRRWSSSCPSGAARASRCARAERGEKRRLAGARAAERAARARVRGRRRRAEAAAARRGARGAARGAQPREPADPDRVLRHLEHPGAADRRLDGRVRGRDAEEGALPQVRRARAGRAGRLRGDGRGRLAPLRAARGVAAPTTTTRPSRSTPNLVVIDGGKGQLSAALAAMQAYDLPRVAVIALAKRDRGGVRARARPTRSPARPHSPGLQLLQRIRDEAHRFALTFHRQRRDAQARESMFDQLEGVGPARRRALLRHFGSAERVLAATQEELEGVPGVPAKTARQIYAQLHKAGRA